MSVAPRNSIGWVRRQWRFAAVVIGLLVTGLTHHAVAQAEISDPDEQVIHYHSDQGLADPVAHLQKRIASGEVSLSFDANRGYLDSLLRSLGISPASQGLVFSKSSSQADRTTPRTPRAIYFKDDVSVGWVPGGKVIDVAAVDPQRGPVFYTLEQNSNAAPRFSRTADCLRCHSNPQTLNVPGLLVRSFYTAEDGAPLAKVLRFVNGHNSPLDQRWGGWYVTGTHEKDLHLGNIFATDRGNPEKVDLKAGANVTDLKDRFDHTNYLSSQSDIVALLVLEHQSRMQNLITRANYETRLALDPGVAEGEKRSDKTEQGALSPRISAAGETLLEYMLFRNEVTFKGQIKGTTRYAAEFEKRGPNDLHGRSLRQLNLQTRLFTYPCSYMIYSASFDTLPKEMKLYLWRRLDEILTGKDSQPTFAAMPATDRQAVREILLETMPQFAEWVRSHPAAELSRIDQ